MINLIDVIPYMTVMTDILLLDTRQCHWNSTGNWVAELVYWLAAQLTWSRWLVNRTKIQFFFESVPLNASHWVHLVSSNIISIYLPSSVITSQWMSLPVEISQIIFHYSKSSQEKISNDFIHSKSFKSTQSLDCKSLPDIANLQIIASHYKSMPAIASYCQ